MDFETWWNYQEESKLYPGLERPLRRLARRAWDACGTNTTMVSPENFKISTAAAEKLWRKSAANIEYGGKQ